jgi:hypothetical protein
MGKQGNGASSQAHQRTHDKHEKKEYADLLLYVVGRRILPHRRFSPT